MFPAADAIVELRPDFVRLTTPSRPTASRNEVFWCESPDCVEPVVADYQARGLPFKWSCPPVPGLAEALRRHCSQEWLARAMRLEGRLSGGDRVVEVTEATLPLFLSCSESGWGHDRQQSEDLAAAWRAGTHRFFLALQDEEPAGTAALSELPGLSYLLGAQVLPSFRGRGLYRELLAARANVALNPLGTLSRESTSAPILEALGFETVVRYRMFQS